MAIVVVFTNVRIVPSQSESASKTSQARDQKLGNTMSGQMIVSISTSELSESKTS